MKDPRREDKREREMSGWLQMKGGKKRGKERGAKEKKRKEQTGCERKSLEKRREMLDEEKQMENIKP